jgi:ACS family tartrate transporter-like MFS transporter
MILTGTAAASGIAWINSVGSLGGFFGPTMVGWAKDYTGCFAGGLCARGFCPDVRRDLRVVAAHSQSDAARHSGPAGGIV